MLTTSIASREVEKALSWLGKFWQRPIRPEYRSVATVDEAVTLLELYGKEARLFAGGIDMLGLLKSRLIAPEMLINIKPIQSIKQIGHYHDHIAIGSGSRIRELENSGLLKEKLPMLFEAAGQISSPQVRNMATVGGNLCQETRCWYFRRSPLTGNTFDCRRKCEDGPCHGREGENQYLGIIGGQECATVCPSDLATVFSALDAKIKTVNPQGGRAIPIDEFYTPFGNALGPGEIITGVEVPDPGEGVKQRFLKFRLRGAIDFAIVSVAAVVKQHLDTVTDVRIVLGGVSSQPYRALAAEELLRGQRLTEKLAAAAAEASLLEAVPLSKNGYKVPILKALVKRALLE